MNGEGLLNSLINEKRLYFLQEYINQHKESYNIEDT